MRGVYSRVVVGLLLAAAIFVPSMCCGHWLARGRDQAVFDSDLEPQSGGESDVLAATELRQAEERAERAAIAEQVPEDKLQWFRGREDASLTPPSYSDS
jgi:hypothetical protein